MTSTPTDPFEQVIRSAQESWLIDSFAPKTDALRHLRKLLEDVQTAADRRLGAGLAVINEAVIIEQFQRNPDRIRAFLQALGSSSSPDMLLMAWRILDGMSIESVSMEYEQEKSFHLLVRLAATDPLAAIEEYESSDIDDAALLRHFGIMKMSGVPIFDGFYALHMQTK